MNIVELCERMFDKSVIDYHKTDDVDAVMPTYTDVTGFALLLYKKNWVDAVQWHLEDIIRDPEINPVEALALKRRIDRSNQVRTDMVEQIDDYFLQNTFSGVSPKADATVNTESPAWAIDRLSILVLKIYHMQEQIERNDASEEHIKKCANKLAVLKEQYADLTQSIKELLNDIQIGEKRMKVYRQMKMYNDTDTNPVLYGKK